MQNVLETLAECGWGRVDPDSRGVCLPGGSRWKSSGSCVSGVREHEFTNTVLSHLIPSICEAWEVRRLCPRVSTFCPAHCGSVPSQFKGMGCRRAGESLCPGGVAALLDCRSHRAGSVPVHEPPAQIGTSWESPLSPPVLQRQTGILAPQGARAR